jgi:hypothetical protein
MLGLEPASFLLFRLSILLLFAEQPDKKAVAVAAVAFKKLLLFIITFPEKVQAQPSPDNIAGENFSRNFPFDFIFCFPTHHNYNNTKIPPQSQDNFGRLSILCRKNRQRGVDIRQEIGFFAQFLQTITIAFYSFKPIFTSSTHHPGFAGIFI